MVLPSNWAWWGLGWLMLPRMTIGIFIMKFTPYRTLGLVLAIIGAFCDLGGNGGSNNKK